MKTFLTGDTHFGHANIIRYCSRPFTSVEEMNRKLIENWNAVVGPKDTVWHLGDFGMLSDREAADIFHALNGEKNLIIGNHDVDKRGRVVQSIARLPWKREPTHLAEIKHNGNIIVLSHYAGLTWNKAHYGSYQAFGHSHGGIHSLPGSVDVGVDNQDFRPISVEEFVRQAEESIHNAEYLVELTVRQIRERIPAYKERSRTIRSA